MDPDETGGALDGLIASGRTRYVGVSNMSPSRFDLLASCVKAPLVTNQIEFSPLFLEPISNGRFDHAIRHGYRPMIWSPVGGGRLLTGEDDLAVRVRARLSDIATRLGLDGPADAAMAFVTRHPAGGLPIVGSGKRERVDGAIKAASLIMDRQDWYAVVTETSPMLEL
jgi:predicted oxidoreductase